MDALRQDITTLREMVERLKQLAEEIREIEGQDTGTATGQGIGTAARPSKLA
jgi:hypothetical protein